MIVISAAARSIGGRISRNVIHSVKDIVVSVSSVRTVGAVLERDHGFGRMLLDDLAKLSCERGDILTYLSNIPLSYLNVAVQKSLNKSFTVE